MKNASEIEAQFWELCNRAQRNEDAHFQKICDASVSAYEAHLESQASEKAMIEIIELVEANPEHRDVFVRCFCDLVLWKRPAPFFLVAFCMRRLRFPEIPELIHRDADSSKGTKYYADRMNFWSHINHAYLDEVWECAICFDFYRHEASRGASPHRT